MTAPHTVPDNNGIAVVEDLRPAWLRPATPGDSNQAAALIYQPMGRMADYIFGGDDRDCALEVFRRLFAQSQNRFSHEFSSVLELDSEVAGLLLAYPAENLAGLAAPMAKQLREIIGWGGMLRLLRRSMPLMTVKEYETDEFYIFTVSVHPNFQRRGFGKQLLAHAEDKARAAGLQKCSLGVTIDNAGAVRLYQRHNYRIVDTVRVPHLEAAIGYPGYHRMVKTLAPDPAESELAHAERGRPRPQ
jgi:ribosomal protein S18 acetylase RimI-like enzyme